MRFYLCSGTSRAASMEDAQRALEARGQEVTSTWHSSAYLHLEPGDPEMTFQALSDLGDIRRADTLIAFSSNGSGTNRGGRHFEAGYAHALGKQIWLIGPPEHAFHTLAKRKFDTWADALNFVEEVHE